MADDGIAFDGRMAETAPVGRRRNGVCGACRSLRGARAQGRGAQPLRRPADPQRGALGCFCRADADRLRPLYRQSRASRDRTGPTAPGDRLFWLHNPAGYLKKPRNLWRLARWRPILVATGAYHAQTIPAWLPCAGRQIIPYGILDRFRQATAREPPPPRAIFTSNPLRGLDWLLDLWVARIAPAVPQAELHIYAGAAVYGGAARPGPIEAILARRRSARRIAACGALRRSAARSWRQPSPARG